MPDFYDDLEFPPKAEYLGVYKDYEVDITHWRDLSAQFGQTFRKVYARRSAAVLLVYGPMGAGKSLFSKRLVDDYKRANEGDCVPDLRDNLWHALIAADPPSEEQIRDVTNEVRVEQVDEGGLTKIRAAGVDPNVRVRVILLDDAQKDGMVRPWTEMQASEFYGARQSGPDALLAHVAERINHACRNELQRSIFVMLSNDKKWLQDLKGHLDRWYQGLATLVDLPVPPPQTLERIVRINTNRLNKVSYWYCLDAAKSEKRRHVRDVFIKRLGFTDAFDAVSESLAGSSRRRGRPGNRNVLTLVTLGSEFADVQEFLEGRDIECDAFHPSSPHHVGVWEMAQTWASKIIKKGKPAQGFLRRARMLESEFVFRWVSLDMVATYALLQPPKPSDLGGRILKLVTRRPSVGDTSDKTEEWRTECKSIDAACDSPPFPMEDVDRLLQDFHRLGQRRNTLYEPAIKARVGGDYGKGFSVFPCLRPDLIVRESVKKGKSSVEYGEYKPCEVTRNVAESKDDKSIDDAIADGILRTGHGIEFTAFLRDNLGSLESYLVEKIGVYAAMLEGV